MSNQHATEPAPVTAGLSRREIHHHAQAAPSPAPSLWQRLNGAPSHPVALTVGTMTVGVLAGIGAGAVLSL